MSKLDLIKQNGKKRERNGEMVKDEHCRLKHVWWMHIDTELL